MTSPTATRIPSHPGQVSSVLALAGYLSTLERDQLETLLAVRDIAQPNRVHDTIDLAESLLKPESIRTALTELTRHDLHALTMLAADGSHATDEAARHRIVSRAVALSVDARTEALPEVTAELSQLLEERNLTVDALSETRATAAGIPRDESAEHVTSERAFECVRVASHLVRLVSAHPLSLRSGCSLSSSSLQFVTTATGANDALVVATIAMLTARDVLACSGTTLVVAQARDDWHTWSRPERFAQLAAAWLRAQPEMVRETFAASSGLSQGSLTQQFATLHPLATDAHVTQFAASLRDAAEAGLVMDGRLTQAGELLVAGASAELETWLTERFPTAVSQFYVQPDLSIIAPGPLELSLEAVVVQIAELESTGLASTYRIAAQSLESALDAGLTEAEIRAFLAEHSLTGIPQPVDYLLGETTRRHRTILVRAAHAGGRTTVAVNNPTLLTQLLVDRALQPLTLTALNDTTADTLIDAETVTRMIRSAGYPASHDAPADQERATAQEGATAQTTAAEHSETPATKNASRARRSPLAQPISEMVERILTRTAQKHDTASVERLLQYAVRHKERLRVVLQQPDGAERAFVLRPVGVKNGRLRGIDEAAEVERTLPIEQLSSVEQVHVEQP